MMNIKSKIFLTLFLIIGLLCQTGCKKDWFDIKSDKDLTVPKTLTDFEYLLDYNSGGIGSMNSGSPGLGEICSDGHYTPDPMLLKLTGAAVNLNQFNAYTWTNNFPYLEVKDWNQAYNRIFICNLVLDGLKKIEGIKTKEQSQLNRVKGNALFHRAINYYNLAQIYAQPYKAESAFSDLGLPLKEGIDITQLSKRVSVQQTYDQIILDLLEATDLLPITPTFLTRGSKTSTFALLARVYLSMQDYQNAGKYAGLSLTQYSTLMDYNDISNTSSTLGLLNPEVLFHSTLVNWNIVFSTGNIFIDSDLFYSYNNNDLRKDRYFRINRDNTITFKGMYNNNTLQFSGLATDEVYLIRAECLARTGKVTEAMKDLNTLMKKRWDKNVLYPTFTAVDANDALRQILEERKKELILRGIRWSDLRRLNLESEHQTTLTRTVLGKTYVLEPNSFKYTLPIPKDVLDLSNMQQNPGW